MKMFLGLLSGFAAAAFAASPAQADGYPYARSSYYGGGYGHQQHHGGLGHHHHHHHHNHWDRGYNRFGSFGLSIGLPYRSLRLGYGGLGYGGLGYGGLGYGGLGYGGLGYGGLGYGGYSPYDLGSSYFGLSISSYSPYSLYSTPSYFTAGAYQPSYQPYSGCYSAPVYSYVPEVPSDCCWPADSIPPAVSPAAPMPDAGPSASRDGVEFDFDRTVEIDASVPAPAVVPTTLQVQSQSLKGYPIVADSSWVGSAVTAIDMMAEKDGLLAAEAACRQMIAVRENLPSGVHLRAGLLGLMNGSSPQAVARDFRAAAGERVRIGRSSVSPRFARVLRLDDAATLEPFVQQAAKTLLAGGGAPTDAAGVASARLVSVDASVATPAADSVQSLSASSDTRVILDTLLRLSGQRTKADAIASAFGDR